MRMKAQEHARIMDERITDAIYNATRNGTPGRPFVVYAEATPIMATECDGVFTITSL